MRLQQFLELKKELDVLLKKYNVITPKSQGHIIVHVNKGHVSKIWENVDIEGRIVG